ncbi:MAG TPA: hypothetical protein VFM93_00295 [Candidatus Limnocylindria bacterium]|nr:hypothetical protein [Candidatus Limnocylindria bacterium]
MLRRPSLSLAATAVLVLALATPASAHSSTVSDPTGDISATEPAYLDIVAAKITEQVGTATLYLMIEHTVAIPDAPTGFRAWNWFISASSSSPPMYVATVRFCAAPVAACASTPRWETILLDLTTTPPTVTFNAFPFKVDGATVKAFVGADQLGLAGDASFAWSTASRSSPAVPGNPIADRTAASSFSR